MQSKKPLLKIAIQGIHGCFHEQAALKFFKQTKPFEVSNLEFDECDSFEKLADFVVSGKSDYGVMAIENTLAGSLLNNYNLLTRCNLKISGEIYLPIAMHLLAIAETEIDKITEVYSHPIALAQCRRYLDQDLKAKKIEFFDTAGAAKKIKQDALPQRGALAGEYAASFYGLKILKRNVETHKQNHTRFLVIAKDKQDLADSDKASLYFEVSHKVGSLNQVLNIFEKYQLNLTKIQSSPIEGRPFEYYFHVDLTWHNKKKFDQAMLEAEQFAENLEILGCYRKGQG